MTLPDNVKTQLEALLTEALADKIKKNVEITGVEIDREAGEIRFKLAVYDTISPTEFADDYFGLTTRMRRSMAKREEFWNGFFPVITPSLGVAHA